MAAHEINRTYCRALGDLSQAPWDNAQTWQQESALAGVDAVFAGKGPEALHVAWCEAKKLDGWVWGPVKDAEARTHPCLLSYAELPPDQKQKDHLFVATVHAMAKALGHPVPDAVPAMSVGGSLKVTTRPV